jgi:hypothetical protein
MAVIATIFRCAVGTDRAFFRRVRCAPRPLKCVRHRLDFLHFRLLVWLSGAGMAAVTWHGAATASVSLEIAELARQLKQIGLRYACNIAHREITPASIPL